MKKLLSIILALTLLMGIVSVGAGSAYALSDNQRADAVKLAVDGTAVNDILETENSRNTYTFTLDQPADVKILLTSLTSIEYNLVVRLEDSSGYPLYDVLPGLVPTADKLNNGKAKYYALNEVLLAGTYYLDICYDVLTVTDSTFTPEEAPNYSLAVTATEVDLYSAEPDDTAETAQKLRENQVAYSYVDKKDTLDVFEFTLNEKKRVNIRTAGWVYDDYYHKYLFDLVIYKKVNNKLKETNKNLNHFGTFRKVKVVGDNSYTRCDSFILDAGTYYIGIKEDCGDYENCRVKLMYQTQKAPAVFRNAKNNHLVLDKVFIKAGDTFELAVDNGKVKKWSTSNAKVLKVAGKTYGNAKLTGLKSGIVRVTAELTDGRTVTEKFSVRYNPHFSNGQKKIKAVKVKKNTAVKVYINNKVKGSKYEVVSAKNLKITGKKTNRYFLLKGLKAGKTTLKMKVNGTVIKLNVTVK
jgi:hypothetical protein